MSRVLDAVPAWIRGLAPYAPGLPTEELERRYGITGSIKLASNENPLGPSPRALAALAGALASLHRYPDGSAFHLTRRLAERHGVEPEAIVIGNGSNEILELLVRTFMQPGDEAVMAAGAFLVYALVVQAAGGRGHQVPLRDFTHDLPAMAAAVTDRTRLVFVANPNNPTGTIVRRDAWRTFLTTLVAALALLQQPAPEAKKPEVTTINARLGDCSADFTVKDPDGKPLYNATIHVRVRYGFLGVKRMDLEVGTNADGQARVEGLPDDARPLMYDITRGELKAEVQQDPSKRCSVTFDVSLK
jgi:hypothetical protein